MNRLRAVLEPQHLVTLSCVEDALGEELQVVWEAEPGARAIDRAALPAPTGLDAPLRLDALLEAVRWGASSLADTRSVQASFRSGIDIEGYQLDPVVRAVQMPCANLLIADAVGLVPIRIMMRRDAIQVGEDPVCQKESPLSSPCQTHPQHRRMFRVDRRALGSP